METEPFLFSTMLLPSSSCNEAQFVVTDGAVVLGLDLRLLEHLRRRAADVERPHGELRAGLADGLRGDDADGLAELDQAAGRQVAAVAIDADAVLAFAGEHRADAHAFNARGFNALGLVLVNFLVGLDEKFLRVRRVHDVVAREPADEAVAELDHFVFAFVNGLRPRCRWSCRNPPPG